MALVKPPRDISPQLIREKWHDFTEFQVWPLKSKLNPEAWLGNFKPEERIYAYHLMNAFMYFSDDIINQLFIASMQSLSLVAPPQMGLDDRGRWKTFLTDAVVTYVTGENPHPADSGHLFSRKARDVLQFAETKILRPEEAVARILAGWGGPVIFVDDFVGSGAQFCETWERRYLVGGQYVSFGDLERSKRTPPVFYAVPVATEAGISRIGRRCPGVRVSAANVLTEQYSIFHPDSLAWPEDLQSAGPEFVRVKSLALGIPANGSARDYRGFQQLGLALAFAHKTPDATIPLFTWDKGGWHPLIAEG